MLRGDDDGDSRRTSTPPRGNVTADADASTHYPESMDARNRQSRPGDRDDLPHRHRGSTLEGESSRPEESRVRLKAVVHEAEEGGFWAEVPAIPGCATQGDTFEELLENLHEAVEGCLSVEVTEVATGAGDRVIDIAV